MSMYLFERGQNIEDIDKEFFWCIKRSSSRSTRLDNVINDNTHLS